MEGDEEGTERTLRPGPEPSPVRWAAWEAGRVQGRRRTGDSFTPAETPPPPHQQEARSTEVPPEACTGASASGSVCFLSAPLPATG